MFANNLYTSIALLSSSCANNFEELKYKYGNVSYPIFSQKYSYQGYIKRKIFAFPKIIHTITTKLLLHFVIMILKGVPKVYKNENSCLKLYYFKVLRDIEETSGWFITIFHDKMGSYLVQESNFQKKCYNKYNLFLKKNKASNFFFKSTLNNVAQNAFDKKDLDKLFVYSKKGIDRYQSLIGSYVKNILASNPTSFYFEKLTETQCKNLDFSSLDPEILLKIFLNNEIGRKRYEILLPEQRSTILKKISINDLLLFPRYLQLNYLASIQPDDFKNYNFKKINLNVLVLLFNINSEERKKCIKYLSSNQVQDIIQRLNENQFWFFQIITKKQRIGLDLDLIGSKKFYWLAYNRKVFSTFTTQQLQKILVQLDKSYLRMLTSMQLKKLDLSELSSSKIEEIFTRDSFAWNDLNEISIKQLQKILPILDLKLLIKIKAKRLIKLDLTVLTDEIRKELEQKIEQDVFAV